MPKGFLDEVLGDPLPLAIGASVSSAGHLFVWERQGVIFLVEDGIPQSQPFLDVQEEVTSWGDHGLMSFALDPDFLSNGYVYLLYTVDYHHLTKYGTPEYDPQVTTEGVDTIGRVTRYTAQISTGFRTVDPASRLILLGESMTTGIPIASDSHGVGTLLFGEDGTLLVSTGESAAGPGSGTALADGIFRPKEDVGSFRAQLVDSLCGKILRVDPLTGDGVSSNPYFDSRAPRSPRSRVWALGLRNPFRMTLRPGTGVADPGLADPGTVYVGDVGDTTWEELSVVENGGDNLGWPIFEGLELHPIHSQNMTINYDALNPLFGQPLPGGGVCQQRFFYFQDLILQESQNTPFWGNPCFRNIPIDSSVPLFMHRRPALDWSHHGEESPGEDQGEGVARVPTFDRLGNATVAELGDPNCPVAGESFVGTCSVGGDFYTGLSFPAEYHGSYFHADFSHGWIRNLRFNGAGELSEVVVFAEPAGRVVDVEYDSHGDVLWYIDYTDLGLARLHRVSYVADNTPPDAVAGVLGPHWGEAPLTVTFDGTGSSDSENQLLSYHWEFQDGTPHSLLARPTRILPSEDITAAGTVIARVLTMTPPGSMGTGNSDIEVIRDGDWPPPWTNNPIRQYDTLHVDENFLPDKQWDDWVGYEFPETHLFTSLIFQEGMTYSGLGGHLLYFIVEVRQNGVWNAVGNLVIDPMYPGEVLPSFETFEMRFEPAAGDAIRLHGVPSGSLQFFTIGELRVLAEPDPLPHEPFNIEVLLTVSDAAGAVDTDTVFVSVNDNPPFAEILAPANGGTYSTESPQLIQLVGAASDALDPASTLACSWQVFLHHDEHVHPGPIDPLCATTALLSTEGCMGELNFQEVRFTARDSSGLVTSLSHFLIPNCDQNMNFIDDAVDLASGTSRDENGNGVPDEAEVDCDGDGLSDIFELFFGYDTDLDGSGVPDGCEGLKGQSENGGSAGAPLPSSGPSLPGPSSG